MENKRCVYVGNIPYHAAEKEILEVLQEAGPVVSLELATEKDTGKSKGHGFCEYRDEETALSAIRNLNGYPIRGRELRVDVDKRNKGGRDKNPSPPQTMQAPNPRPISEFPAAVESVLLQQVLSLPPEKLSSLPPWEQQQVIQLQRMYGSARSDLAGIICR